MQRLLIVTFSFVLTLGLVSSSARAAAKDPQQQLMSRLSWRSIGPYIGGRVVAVAGVPSNPDLFYMGGVEGGIWKSTDYGQNWSNISDDTLPGIASPIGALAVADSNPKVIYAGTGESDIRNDFDTGDGIYKSTDAGKTWRYAGLRETHMTTNLTIDPRNANVVYAASMGHVFAPNPERGIFKTTDGGKSWKRILYVDADTGGVDMSMDKRDPNTIYASMWQAQRFPWKLVSGGPGSGLYKTTDGGAHWTNLSRNPGFPTGTLGKIGVSIAQSDPRRVYAIVQAKDGGVFRSDDGGRTWKHLNNQWKLRQRAFYYMAIFADPANSNRVYAPNVDAMYVSTDGGKVWKGLEGNTHGDHHILWINPRHTNILLEGNDGGATVSVNRGDTFSREDNQPTGQIYHIALDNQFPFHIFGASQDEASWEYTSAFVGGSIPPSELHTVALGESTFIAPDPDNPLVTFGSGYYSTFVELNRVTGQEKNVSPWPRLMSGAAAADMKYRFTWTHPALFAPMFSPANPRELLLVAQVVFSSLDRGRTWKAISPDLTRNDPSTQGLSGGPIDYDNTGAELFPDISSLAVSPLD
ncbi:MAG: glycosyl hydrolase, partial [Candidatus Tumulicola sp.]